MHILGHIPPGHTDCLAVWSKNYYRIVDRYVAVDVEWVRLRMAQASVGMMYTSRD